MPSLVFVVCRICAPVCEFFHHMIEPKYIASRDVYAPMFFCDLITFLIVVFGYASFGPSVIYFIFNFLLCSLLFVDCITAILKMMIYCADQFVVCRVSFVKTGLGESCFRTVCNISCVSVVFCLFYHLFIGTRVHCLHSKCKALNTHRFLFRFVAEIESCDVSQE